MLQGGLSFLYLPDTLLITKITGSGVHKMHVFAAPDHFYGEYPES